MEKLHISLRLRRSLLDVMQRLAGALVAPQLILMLKGHAVCGAQCECVCVVQPFDG